MKIQLRKISIQIPQPDFSIIFFEDLYIKKTKVGVAWDRGSGHRGEFFPTSAEGRMLIWNSETFFRKMGEGISRLPKDDEQISQSIMCQPCGEFILKAAILKDVLLKTKEGNKLTNTSLAESFILLFPDKTIKKPVPK